MLQQTPRGVTSLYFFRSWVHDEDATHTKNANPAQTVPIIIKSKADLEYDARIVESAISLLVHSTALPMSAIAACIGKNGVAGLERVHIGEVVLM